MKEKKTIVYIAIIIGLILVLGLIWYFITNNDNTREMNGPGMPNGNSNVSYSAKKEITRDETITEGEFSSNKFIYTVTKSGKYRLEVSYKGNGFLYTNPFNIKEKTKINE